MEKQDKLFDEFKNFELEVQSRKLTFGSQEIERCRTETTICTQTECGSDDTEMVSEDVVGC